MPSEEQELKYMNAPGDRPSYEHALRIVGRFLDAEPAYHVTLVEVDDGFTVRYSPVRHRTEGRTVRFSWERLRDLRVFNTAARGMGSKPGRYTGLHIEVPGGYQEFLRSLGSTLDNCDATNVSLDALPAGMAVSYLCEDHGNPFEAQKHYRVLDRAEMEAVVADAKSQRMTNVTPIHR